MATVVNNPIMKGLRGSFGDVLVFRQVRGQTRVCPKPRTPDKQKETPAQRKTRSTFREATQWAQQVLKDPERKAYYTKRAKVLRLPNAYTAAITDFMRKPKVHALVNKKQVVVSVSKPGFELKQVEVKARSENQPVQAIRINKESGLWKFRLEKAAAEQELTLTVVVLDGFEQVVQMELQV